MCDTGTLAQLVNASSTANLYKSMIGRYSHSEHGITPKSSSVHCSMSRSDSDMSHNAMVSLIVVSSGTYICYCTAGLTLECSTPTEHFDYLVQIS